MQQNLDKFKFRAWDKGSSNVKAQMIYCSGFSVLDGNIIRLYDKYGHIIDSCCATIQNLMQSSGLKDKNGKLVFEGDIVKIKINAEKEHIFEIIWNERRACFDYEPKINTESLIIFLNEAEVIGNIFEQPQLLKKI